VGAVTVRLWTLPIVDDVLAVAVAADEFWLSDALATTLKV
jgi:hypothetical protein